MCTLNTIVCANTNVCESIIIIFSSFKIVFVLLPVMTLDEVIYVVMLAIFVHD